MNFNYMVDFNLRNSEVVLTVSRFHTRNTVLCATNCYAQVNTSEESELLYTVAFQCVQRCCKYTLLALNYLYSIHGLPKLHLLLALP
jgi:hypothetical protein